MTEDPDAKHHFRMDFTQVPVGIPELSEDEDGEPMIESIQLAFRFRPNPERYERSEDPPGWIDTYDDLLIPDEQLEPLLNERDDGTVEFGMPEDVPRYYDPPEVEDIEEYSEQRVPEIELSMSGETPVSMVQPDRSELKDLKDEDISDFIILSLDIVNSTGLMTNMPVGRATKMIHVYLNEIARLIRRFHGEILSVNGDGFIAYLSGPNLSGMHDNAADCATSVDYLVETAINDVFSNQGFQIPEYRIGIDTGSPEIVPQGDSNHNLMGATVSLASKIQEEARPNEILLGEATERNLHTSWRSDTESVTDDRDWEYHVDDELYDIYKLDSSYLS